MADIVDQATRSRMMANIKGTNTRPEIALRRALHALGLRFRLHAKELPGRPDVVLPRWKAVIFVHGCFWHRHVGCRYTTQPATRSDFWGKKFSATIKRDRANIQKLADAGWRVLIVWECELKERGAEGVASDVLVWLSSEREIDTKSNAARIL